MLWYNSTIRRTETSYIIITKQQSVEVPMLSVHSLYKMVGY